MDTHIKYMTRCLELAGLGHGYVRPNPLVGAVLVYNDKIIGEGFHELFGGAHAEVNCIKNVSEQHRKFIPFSTLYVSLEPCAHFGKTPPCTDLIIANKIKKVVIGTRDPFSEVNGRGVEKLVAAGIHVIENVLESECKLLNKRFFTFHKFKRPYIVLKWAQSSDLKIASENSSNLKISNPVSEMIVHKWRSLEHAILVGTRTALLDNPELTNRQWYGTNPIRLVLDRNLDIPAHSKIYNNCSRTIIINETKEGEDSNIIFKKLSGNIISELLKYCFQENIQSIFIEGGATTLQRFIDSNLWDEAKIITNKLMKIPGGLDAPKLSNYKKSNSFNLLNDEVSIYCNTSVNK